MNCGEALTLIGPHRDDLELLIDDRPLSSFGSRGQQRLAVVALKLAEADVISGMGEQPVLLLDDVLSELDTAHRSALLQYIRDFGAQILITSADPEHVSGTPLEVLDTALVTPGGIESVPGVRDPRPDG